MALHKCQYSWGSPNTDLTTTHTHTHTKLWSFIRRTGKGGAIISAWRFVVLTANVSLSHTLRAFTLIVLYPSLTSLIAEIDQITMGKETARPKLDLQILIPFKPLNSFCERIFYEKVKVEMIDQHFLRVNKITQVESHWECFSLV